MDEARVRLTPRGVLAGAFTAVVEESQNPKAWWRSSPLITSIGLEHHLAESGWEIERSAELDRLRAIEAAARDVDAAWTGNVGPTIRWSIEASEALEVLRSALEVPSDAR